MSARGALAMDLLNAGLAREHVDRRTRDFRDEVLREAAEKIRANGAKYKGSLFNGERLGAQLAADLIDPDKESN